MPAVGCAPSTRNRIWAEEALLGYQVLLRIHQVPHVVILQQRAVEGAVQGAGRAQILILGRRETEDGSLSPPQRLASYGWLKEVQEVRIGLEAWDPGVASLSIHFRGVLSHRQGQGGKASTWMTTKRWGSLAMRENSATNSRNRGRHSESIIQPGDRRKLSICFRCSLCAAPPPLPLQSGLAIRAPSPCVVELRYQDF